MSRKRDDRQLPLRFDNAESDGSRGANDAPVARSAEVIPLSSYRCLNQWQKHATDGADQLLKQALAAVKLF